VSFDVSAGAYGQFMGRYSTPLARLFADLADPQRGFRVLDVGCGPGALTAELVSRVGVAAVSAVDPSQPFVASVRDRFPGLDVRLAAAEALPYPNATFDQTLAQLVVHFMTDPVAGLTEMRRVTRPGGVIAASVWDFGRERAPLSLFWRAARDLDPATNDESGLPGARAGDLIRLFGLAGLTGSTETTLTVQARYETFDQWWEPYTFRVGPAGAHVASLAPQAQSDLRERCKQLLPAGPIEITATAWAVRCRV
jgi:ubiquinone/menaquinone biosynthesis C-methylase UbiE